jgi:tetratricopeptide (TPR) repeat protein
MLDALRSQCSAYGSFHEFAGAASELTGNFRMAADELERALTLDRQLSNDPTVFLWFARALLETRQSARLTKFLSALHSPPSPPVLFSLAMLFARHGDYRQAIHYFQQIPPQLADDAVYFNIGLAYSRLRQFEEARKCYFEAIDKQSAHVEAYFRVGLDFAASGDLRKAVPWLLRARELAPERADIAYALTEQLLILQYVDTAEQISSKALAANPQNPLLRAARGDVLLARGKIPEAVESYQSALTLAPKLPGALLGLARVASTHGNTAEASQKLQEVLSIDPENPVVNAELGSIEVEAANWTDAYRHLAKAWSSDRSNLTVALHLARSLQHLNRAADALQVLQPLATALRDSPTFHSELAQIYGQLHRTAEAQAERGEAANLQANGQHSLHFEDPTTYVH